MGQVVPRPKVGGQSGSHGTSFAEGMYPILQRLHLKIDYDSLKSYHAIGRNHYHFDFAALIFRRMSQWERLLESTLGPPILVWQ
jgi:hypothetical protein